MGLLAVVLLPSGSVSLAAQATTPPARGPIIDVHFHAEPRASNPVTGVLPPWRNQADFVAAAFDTLGHYRIVRAVTSGRLEEVARWHARDSLRIVPAVWTLDGYPLPSVDRLRVKLAGEGGSASP
jgi:hypothetical protein